MVQQALNTDSRFGVGNVPEGEGQLKRKVSRACDKAVEDGNNLWKVPENGMEIGHDFPGAQSRVLQGEPKEHNRESRIGIAGRARMAEQIKRHDRSRAIMRSSGRTSARPDPAIGEGSVVHAIHKRPQLA
jgi:hypothetical protein